MAFTDRSSEHISPHVLTSPVHTSAYKVAAMSPSLEVSHLASSTSFYAAILQPLGLHFIAPPEEERGAVATLPSTSAFGQDEDDVFLELQQSENPLKPPKLSSIVISAPSSSAVAGFHSAWRKADPPLWSKFRDRRGLEKHFNDLEAARSGPWQANDPRSGALVTRAVVYDLDGNRCEVVYQQSHHRRQPPRILNWTPDVESAPAHTPSSRISLRKNSNSNTQRPAAMPPSHHESPFSAGGRSAYAPAAAPTAAEDSASPRQSSRQGGLNTTTVVGALLGVAAGAALTYGFVSSNSRDSSAEAPERHRAPPRRATFPEKPVSSSRHHQSYHENGIMPVDSYRDHKTPRKLAYPDFQGLSIRGGSYGDGDEDDDDDAEFAKNPWADARSPRYLTQGPPPAQSVITRSRPPSTFRPTEDTREERSRPSSRSQGRASTVRARSEAPRERVSARVVDEHNRGGQRSHRSVVGETVAHTREPTAGHARSMVSRSRRSSVYHNPEHDTFVTAPTHRSMAPSRHHDYEYGGREMSSRSRAPSQVSGTSTVRERARGPASHAAVSRASARKIPLPMSGVGSSHAPWEARDVPLPMSGVGSSYANWDDDLESVAPSDSISCVGSKHSRRTRRYHH